MAGCRHGSQVLDDDLSDLGINLSIRADGSLPPEHDSEERQTSARSAKP
jgi:hypothetical protein